MKKHYVLFFLALIAAFIPAAAAATYVVDIDDVSRVELDIDGTPVTGLKNGSNSIDMGSAKYLRVTARKGVVFTDVTLIDTYNDNEEISWLNRVETADGLQYIDLHTNFPEDETFRIRTSGAEDVRTATLSVTVDDPSLVRLVRAHSDEPVELVAGKDNIVRFDPATETPMTLTPTGEKPLYRVTLNNKEIESNGYSYTIPAANGDRLAIEALFPDVDCSLTFKFQNDDALNFIKTVDIDGKPFTDFASGKTTVKMGAGLEINGNTNLYEVTTFTINGKSVAYSNPFKFLIEGDTEISIAVKRYASFDMTVDVDDPARVHIYQGYSYNGNEYSLVAGENTVEVLRDTPIVSLVPAEGCYIASLTIGDYAYTREELQVSPVMVGSLKEGEVLKVTTGVIERDDRFALYVSGLESAKDYFKLCRADRSEITSITDGYTLVDFYEGDNSFILTTGAPVASYVYLNGEQIEPEYPDAPNYRPVMTNDDVLKVFFGERPESYNVTFDIVESAKGHYTLVHDLIAPVDAAEIKVFEGTEITLTPDVYTTMTVTLDGNPLEKGTDGSYSFTVTSDSVLKVTSSESGIDSIGADSDSEAIYYDLTGRRISAPEPGVPAIRVVGGHASKIIR